VVVTHLYFVDALARQRIYNWAKSQANRSPNFSSLPSVPIEDSRRKRYTGYDIFKGNGNSEKPRMSDARNIGDWNATVKQAWDVLPPEEKERFNAIARAIDDKPAPADDDPEKGEYYRIL
jgi:hypothetical protein